MPAAAASQPEGPTAVVRPIGRPRDTGLDAAVLAATRELLTETSYEHVSIGEVARRAGVHRPAVYRRWPTKAHLVHEAAFPDRGPIGLAETGDFAADLRALVRVTITTFSEPAVQSAVAGLMGELRDQPELRAELLPRIEARARAHFACLLAAAVQRGEAHPSVDADTLFDAVSGAVLFRVATAPDRLDDLENHLTELLLTGSRTTTTS